MKLFRLTLTATLGVALVALLSAACGGSDSGPGSDEDYVRGLCGALASAGETFDSFEDADFDDEEFVEQLGLSADDLEGMEFDEMFTVLLTAMFEILGPVMQDLADDLGDLNPPADAKAVHDEAVAAIEEFAKLFNEDELDFSTLGDDTFSDVGDVEFPAEIEERLRAVAENISECDELDLFQGEDEG